MKIYPTLAQLRVGCVPYLNARPLVQAYPGEILLDHPAALAEKMRRGQLDVGLISSYALFADPELYYVADGVAIASRGPVYSVFLAHTEPFEEIKTIALDPASLTSSHLARCLLQGQHGREIDYVAEAGPTDARVLIGNQAIQFRQAAGPEWHFIDFGEEWKRVTGHPFVFAVWLLRDGLSVAREAAEELRALHQESATLLGEICESSEFAPEFSRRYLTEHIRYELGSEEKAGLWEFGRSLQQLDLVPAGVFRPIFV